MTEGENARAMVDHVGETRCEKEVCRHLRKWEGVCCNLGPAFVVDNGVWVERHYRQERAGVTND